MDERGIHDTINTLEARMKAIEAIEAPTWSQRYELGVIYMEIGELHAILGHDDEARVWRDDAKAEIGELLDASHNDALYLAHAKAMYDYFGDTYPPQLAAALRAHEDRETEPAKTRGLFARTLRRDEPEGTRGKGTVDGDAVRDVIARVEHARESREAAQRHSKLKRDIRLERLGAAVEKALVKGMYVASLYDYELEYGVEADYLRTILSEEEMRDVRGLRKRVLSGEIDLSEMPSRFRQYDFGKKVLLVNQQFEKRLAELRSRMAYLQDRMKNEKDEKEREALELLRDEVEHQLIPHEILARNSELMLRTGMAARAEGPVDLGTSDARKMFYFINVVTRTLKDHIPALQHLMDRGRKVGTGLAYGRGYEAEDIARGWEYLRTRYPVFNEVEAFGALNMSRAFEALGYRGVRDAIKGRIAQGDGPYTGQVDELLRIAKRIRDTIAQSDAPAGKKQLE